MMVDSGKVPVHRWISKLGMKSDHQIPQICHKHFHQKALKPLILLSSLFVGAKESEP